MRFIDLHKINVGQAMALFELPEFMEINEPTLIKYQYIKPTIRASEKIDLSKILNQIPANYEIHRSRNNGKGGPIFTSSKTIIFTSYSMDNEFNIIKPTICRILRGHGIKVYKRNNDLIVKKNGKEKKIYGEIKRKTDDGILITSNFISVEPPIKDMNEFIDLKKHKKSNKINGNISNIISGIDQLGLPNNVIDSIFNNLFKRLGIKGNSQGFTKQELKIIKEIARKRNNEKWKIKGVL